MSSPIFGADGDPLLSGDPTGTATSQREAAPSPSPGPFASVAEGGKLVYLLAIIGLLGLLVFTVWREFRTALHPHVH